MKTRRSVSVLSAAGILAAALAVSITVGAGVASAYTAPGVCPSVNYAYDWAGNGYDPDFYAGFGYIAELPDPNFPVDYHGCDLHNTDLGLLQDLGADLTGANLSGTNLSSARPGYADLTNATLAGANLTSSNFFGGTLEGTNLSGTSTSGIRSGTITGTPASLPTNFQLTDGYLVGPAANLSAANLYGSDLSGANLTGANLLGATLSTANLNGADLTNANLTNADLSFADLPNTTLTGANFQGAVLQGILSGGATGPVNNLDSAWRFTNGYLVGASARLSGANLAGADLSYMFIDFTDLSGADLSGANLDHTYFDSSDFSGADLTGAAMTYSTLSNTNLDTADLTSATLGGVVSGGITGTPTALPPFWTLSGGFLLYSGPDITAPLSSATVTGGTPTFGVYGGPVNVVVTGTDEDGGTGVASIHWSSSGAQTAGETVVSGDTATIPVSATGTTTVTYWAVDGAGNEGVHHTEVVTIDVRPIVSISPTASALEPDITGSQNFRAIYFQLTVSKPSPVPIVVSYYTRNTGSAQGCASGCDYKSYGSQAVPVTWTIPANTLSSTIGGLSVNSDSTVETEETFEVVLKSATNAAVGQDVGEGHIIDADSLSEGGKPVLMLTPKNSVIEGDSGNAKAQVIINLSKPLTAALPVYFSSSDLDAIGAAACGTGGDYKIVAPKYLTIPAGGLSQTIDVAVCSNASVEFDRQFQITHLPTAAPPGNQLVDVQAPAIVTIVDDDVD